MQALCTDQSSRRIALRLNCAHSTVSRYRLVAVKRGWTPEHVRSLTDDEILKGLSQSKSPSKKKFVEPDWTVVQSQLRKKGVDRFLLWDEYKEGVPTGHAMSYREFCRRLQNSRKRFGLVMRQEHLAGEKLFVDFMGGRPHWCDPSTGELHYVEVFVACMGASNYVYAEALESQSSRDWLGVHVRAFEALGGVPHVLVPDNLKAAVTARPRGQLPTLNPAYAALADHYGAVVEPARPRRPKDKPLVEISVKLVHRALTAILRRRSFFSLGELNEGLKRVVDGLNAKRFSLAPAHSRASLFELIDRPALLPLPATSFSYEAMQVGLAVGADYHVQFEGSSYSVPYHLIGERVDLRVQRGAVEVWRQGQRLAIHLRSPRGARITDPAHMPAKHRMWKERDRDLTGWAAEYGPSVLQICTQHATAKRPQYHRRRTIKYLRELGRVSGRERFEAACARALEIGATEPSNIENILRHGLDRGSRDADEAAPPPRMHANVRGRSYFDREEGK